VSTGTLCIAGRRNTINRGEVGLKVTYDTSSKELKQEENRIYANC
jgi:hypothetical protein